MYIITNKFKSNSKTGRKNKVTCDTPIHFRYVLKDITFFCNNCHEIITINANDKGDIPNRNTLEYKCKCGAIYKIPNHYIDSYQNKNTKIIDKSDK